MTTYVKKHPLGLRSKILLSSVFGPFSQDDEYGSRKINPMELYHNQVTRVQGSFSLRMFHRTFGLMMIQANLDAPCTLLDFPSLDRFIQEIRNNRYDIIGISAITPNLEKVRKMCSLIREHQPQTTIVIGGHIANKVDLPNAIEADHIVKGEGIRWFRKFIGQDVTGPIKHPLTLSAYGARILGVPLHKEHKKGNTAAMLIPSVGCPVGCNFCSTSSLFGGKGNFISFYETGEALFSVMCDIEAKLDVKSFFVMDENFLLHRKRALKLLELMKKNQKSWSLYVFSSARVLKSYGIDQLVQMGISWVWMGLEGQNSSYRKLHGVDTYALVQELQTHGIRVLGSSIIGLEEHTPENIDQVIADAIRHESDFHQFMLYTPVAGTPLFEQYRSNGTLISERTMPVADTHGQYRFNFRHAHIRQGQEEHFLLRAFQQDFDVNGPSLARLIRTLLTGWQKYKNHPDSRIRRRFTREVSPRRSAYAGAVWAMQKYYLKTPRISKKLARLLHTIYAEFGLLTRLIAPLIGCYLYLTLRFEERRLANGWTYEPRTYCEKNSAALALEASKNHKRVHQAPNSFVPAPAHACVNPIK